MLCSSIDVIEVSLLVSGGVLTSAFLMTAFRSAIFLYCCVKMKITEICFSARPPGGRGAQKAKTSAKKGGSHRIF